MDFAAENESVSCSNKVMRIQCAFHRAVDNLRDMYIKDEDCPRNATLMRFYAWYGGVASDGDSPIRLRFEDQNDGFMFNLDEAKKFLEHLTAFVNSADELENKFLKALEEAKKEQQNTASDEFEF